MKDKSKRGATMLDMIKSNANQSSGKSITDTQELLHEATLKAPTLDAQQINDIKSYNENLILTNAEDDNYGDVKPVSQILVKCYLIEPEVSESGLVKPFTQQLEVPTKSGQPGFETVELPYLFSHLVKVIAVPDSITLIKPNQYAQVGDRVIQGTIIGNGYNRKAVITNAFTRADQDHSITIPTDINDPHFGYLLIPMSEIKAVFDNEG